ncbi:MAG: acetylornithine transaminase [Desulfobacteraceae bacterium]|nr:acetylornithine transaminase [Desulfobacteraceae bacterium]MBC2749035.1 acetylornithine transaminase [Desulfobacteraceae bacterium]
MRHPTIDTAEQVLATTYSRMPVVFEKGAGATLWDTEGREYTDFLAGIAVCGLGHAHPAVQAALSEQAGKLLHVSNLFYTKPQVELGEWLIRHSFADRVFFCNSGAEANEAAIKLARKYFYDKGQTGRYRIIAMEQSFHGRTMGSLSATGQAKIRKGFEPVLDGFEFVPFNDLEALHAKLDETVCAVLLEPIQGEGGIVCPDSDYLPAVRKICDETGTLMMLDEIQTGMGRTGKLFAYEHAGAAPDIMTLAKALGNGLPIGAMLAREAVANAFGPGAHATTFGGTPIVTAGALAVVKTMAAEGIVAQAARTGEYFMERLQALERRHDRIAAVRGRGLLLGLKLKEEGAPLVKTCLERGFVINCVQGDILRFAPPLIISTREIDALINCLDDILSTEV